MKKSLVKLCLLACFVAGIPMQSLAQNVTIQGTVSDEEDVIIGASVIAMGGKTGTITDVPCY